MCKIKNVFFDADDTVKDFTREDRKILDTIHEMFDVKDTIRCNFIDAIDKLAFALKNTAMLKTNIHTLNTRLKVYAKILNVDTKEYVKSYYNFLNKNLILFNNVKYVISKLKNKGINVFFITNNPTCKMLGEELGFPKENIYIVPEGRKKCDVMAQILKRYDYEKKETLMVGDNLVEDIYYGKKVGIQTAWINFEGRLYEVFSHMIKPDYKISTIEEVLNII